MLARSFPSAGSLRYSPVRGHLRAALNDHIWSLSQRKTISGYTFYLAVRNTAKSKRQSSRKWIIKRTKVIKKLENNLFRSLKDFPHKHLIHKSRTEILDFKCMLLEISLTHCFTAS